MADNTAVRVRFAPSPTGYLHIGSARTALFNWLFARHHQGRFILRIDDTDQARSTEEAMHGIYESMRWLGLDWDEGPSVGGAYTPYVQSERGEVYKRYLQQLLDTGHAYYCYCTPEELDEMRKQAQAEKRAFRYDGRHRNLTPEQRAQFEKEGRKPVVRFKIPEGTVVVNDLVIGEIQVSTSTLDDFIIVRSNGSPLYLFTSIVDDLEMKITHVIRGSDHQPNTPKHVLISQALGLTPPQFAHVPLVLSAGGEKLSKRRHGDLVAVDKYQQDGYLPQAFINFIVRLGWSLDDEQEIFSVDELIEHFSLDRVGRSASVFDIKKLQWLNKHYIMQLSLPERTDAVIPFLRKAGLLEDTLSPERRRWLEKMVEAVGDRMATLADINTYTSYLFTDEFFYDPQAVKKWWKDKVETAEILKGLRDILKAVEPFDVQAIEAAVWAHLDEKNIKRIQAMQPLRIALSGKSVGPGLFDVVVLLGKEKVIGRLERAVDHLEAGN